MATCQGLGESGAESVMLGLRDILDVFLDYSVPRRYPHVCEALGIYSQPDGVTVELACGGKQYNPYIQGRHFGLDLRTDDYDGPGPEIIADARCLPLSDAAADMLFVVAAMLFIEDWQRVVDESARVLRPGGRLLIFDYKARVARRLGAPNQFTVEMLCRTIEQAGLASEHHTCFLPLRHVGPLRSLHIRRLVAPVGHLLGNWLIVSGRKPI